MPLRDLQLKRDLLPCVQVTLTGCVDAPLHVVQLKDLTLPAVLQFADQAIRLGLALQHDCDLLANVLLKVFLCRHPVREWVSVAGLLHVDLLQLNGSRQQAHLELLELVLVCCYCCYIVSYTYYNRN